jgi:hypothetical protein
MIITPSMDKLVRVMKHNAEQGFFSGSQSEAQGRYFQRCRQEHLKTGTVIIFTRDRGMHTSGWFKNPDYDRCYHLSLTFWDFDAGKQEAFDEKLARAWVHAFYGDWTRYIWHEGITDEGKSSGTANCNHYRVMCNPAWQPIIPRKEVYTKEFIEKGWLSFSDKQYKEENHT